MTIKDLIQKLQQYPDPDMEVGVKTCRLDVYSDGEYDHNEIFMPEVELKVVGLYTVGGNPNNFCHKASHYAEKRVLCLE